MAILSAAGVNLVVDVRRFPSSRRHPQFNRDQLATALTGAGIGYRHLPDLGGRREPGVHSPNNGWRDAGFRGYADHMQTPVFADALTQLTDLAGEFTVAVLCAEADWRRCHRALIADALKLAGFDVVHLLDAQHAEAHPWTGPARIVDGRLNYSAAEPVQRGLDL